MSGIAFVHRDVSHLLDAKEIDRFWKRVAIAEAEACWPFKGKPIPSGYGRHKIKGILIISSRLAWQIANGPIPDGMMVCHHCDVRICCNPRHLFLGTCRDNALDAKAKGRLATGDRNGARLHPTSYVGINAGARNGSAKLTEADVVEIRRRRRNGESVRSLAATYGLAVMPIHEICRGRAWRHVPMEAE